MAATEEELSELHGLTVRCLLDRLKAGEISAAELNVARMLLRDSRISADSKHPTRAVSDLIDELHKDDPHYVPGLPDFQQ